jgi:tetratricopeptide (TPR) repeat protein
VFIIYKWDNSNIGSIKFSGRVTTMSSKQFFLGILIILVISGVAFAGEKNEVVDQSTLCNIDSLKSDLRRLAVSICDTAQFIERIRANANCLAADSFKGSFVDSAIIHLGMGNYAASLSNLDDGLVEADNDNEKLAEIYLYKGIVYALDSNPDFARTFFYKSLNFKKNLEALIGYGILSREYCDEDKAQGVEQLEEAVKIAPDNYDAWLNLGVSYAYSYPCSECNSDQDLDKALASFNRALELIPRDQKAWVLKAGVLGLKGRYDEEMKAYDSAIYYAPKDQFSSFLSEDEKCYEVHKNGGSYMDQLEYIIFTHLMVSGWQQNDHKWWVKRGNKLNELYLPLLALKCYKNSIQEGKNNVEAWLNLGQIYEMFFKDEQAIVYFDSVLVVEPRNTDALLGKGNSLLDLGKADKALIQYGKIMSINSEIPEVWFGRAQAYVEQYAYDRDNPELIENAIQSFKMAIHFRDDYIEAWRELGDFYLRLQKYKEANNCFDEALKIRNDYGEAWRGKSMALYRLGSKEESDECMDSARKYEFDIMEFWYK